MSDRAMCDAVTALEIVQDHFPALVMNEQTYWLVARHIARSLRDSYSAHEQQMMNDLHVIDP